MTRAGVAEESGAGRARVLRRPARSPASSVPGDGGPGRTAMTRPPLGRWSDRRPDGPPTGQESAHPYRGTRPKRRCADGRE